MSSEHTTHDEIELADANTRTDESDASGVERIDVSDHAVLRFRQRVDPRAVNPKEQLRQMFRRGTVADDTDRIVCGKARRCQDFLLIYKGSESQPTIATILSPVPERDQA